MKIKIFALSVFCWVSVQAISLGEGNVENLKQLDYWENGKLRQCVMYDTDGRLRAKAYCRPDGTIEKIEKYDVFGNKIEEALYDQKGKLRTGIDGWASMRWWYDGSNVASQISYDEDGIPLERKQYSESGKLILRQYREELDLNPYEGAQMHMMLGGRNVPYELIKHDGSDGSR